MYTPAAQPLLTLDPDLGQLLTGDRLHAAGRELRARVTELGPGPWQPEWLCAAESASNLGLLILTGTIARELSLSHDAPSAELFGTGDLIRTWRADTTPTLLPTMTRWNVLSPASMALLDRDSALALRRYPEVMTVVLDRLNARAERLAVTQAISQLTGVETRVEALLWQLSERWGRVRPDGVIVTLALSHRMIGSLIGARRATVSTAIARLADDGRIARRADATWLLTGPQPPAPATTRSHHPHTRLARPARRREPRRLTAPTVWSRCSSGDPRYALHWAVADGAPANSRLHVQEQVWVSTIETLVDAAFRWSPAAMPGNRCAPLVIKSCGLVSGSHHRAGLTGHSAWMLAQSAR